MVSRNLLVLGFAAVSVARSVPHKIARQEPSPTASAPNTQSTICGDIIDAVNLGYRLFAASDAYECLTSVPFNTAVASRFIKYWNETLQFQSTLAYLKNPPAEYQQPAVDIVSELASLQQKVDSGAYNNQYDFEADFQLLIYASKDGHISLTAGVLSAFSFGSPFEITSVSVDGKQSPKIFITDDLLPEVASEPWIPSPIATINGTEVNEFLTRYAALNAWGYVEPHAEWNDLMSHPTLDIQGGLTTFSGKGTFYPGDSLTITFENGTDPLELVWLAIYNEPANATGPLTTGGDFYNYFVLGFLPDSFNATQEAPDATEETEPSEPEGAPGNWTEASYGAFPNNPDVAQYDLGTYHSGIVSGYFLEDISTGVLSIPSFDAVPDSIGNWSSAVEDFIRDASAAGLKNVVIDLERNSGGATLLAYLTFKLFFPDLMPFGGSRRRSFEMANILGSATTEWWNSLNEEDTADRYTKYDNAADEWVITDRLNAATGQNFSSWLEYQGPVTANGDSFSLTEQYDLANPTFDQAAFDQWYPTMYLPNRTAWPFQERKWNPDQIVLLTDGLCGSTCSLFLEMMTRVGVKTIVAGGRPVTGPMQAASGNRGASYYSTFALDYDMAFARSIDDNVEANVNASVPEVRDEAIYTKYGGFNLRDQIREGETTPLQFKYEAADCRIYYTKANIYNMTRLWYDVAAAVFEDPSLCVEGSQGFSTTNNTNPKAPPTPSVQQPLLSLNITSVQQTKWDDDALDGLHNGRGRQRGSSPILQCPGNQICDIGYACKQVSVTCAAEGTRIVFACLPSCQSGEQCVGTCALDSATESKRQVYKAADGSPQYQEKLSTGFCYPKQGTRALGCKNDPVVPPFR